MANNVFANGREVACKKGDGKSICAFPDVVWTPPDKVPPTPTGVPVPYPNTAMASDTSKGTKKVKVSGKEIMLKNSSNFKKSVGNEAGVAQLKGFMTMKNTGKMYFQMWSMDVKFEGKNVVRHLDIATHNHGSVPGNSPTWPYVDSSAFTSKHPCVKDAIKEREACNDYKPHKKDGKDACEEAGLGDKPGRAYDVKLPQPSGVAQDRREALDMSARASANDCVAARRCNLKPYSPNGCCPGQTPHHLIEASAFFDEGRGHGDSVALKSIDASKYSEGKAPCVCAEGPTQNVGTHGMMHTHQSTTNAGKPLKELTFGGTKIEVPTTTYKDAKDNAILAMEYVFPNANCDKKCIENQLDAYHNQAGINDDTEIKAVSTGGTKDADMEHALSNAIARAK